MMHTIVLTILLLGTVSDVVAQQPVSQPEAQTASAPASAPAAAPAAQGAPQPFTSDPAPKAGSDWRMVEAVTPGTTLFLNAKGGHKSCKVESVSADAVECKGRNALYPRSAIWSIKVGHRTRSALLAAIPGGALIAGGGIALATEHCSNQSFISFCGLGPTVAVGAGGAIAIIGASVGALTDFSKSTIYTAP